MLKCVILKVFPEILQPCMKEATHAFFFFFLMASDLGTEEIMYWDGY